PLNMLCDSPSNYRSEPECLAFITATPTVWNETRILTGRIGEYIATARRSGETWYVGAMTDWNARELMLDLAFLGDGNFEMECYTDGPNADRAARDYRKHTETVPADRKITVRMAPGGGFAAKITPMR
ncbi:glycoside hydrolase family 97 C-terminal domain-containing protein, partial [uncultured Alistipes sp.]|uniref:glycoside hydrolase family 97 C-terminal domain-containing protein n=1 Tax=uncultured Alistipes sp. TaxID=538949 RepID=UPI002598BD47